MQAVDPPQRLPQTPQLWLSVMRFTQEVPHGEVPAGQVTHVLALHTWFGAQTVVQLPQ